VWVSSKYMPSLVHLPLLTCTFIILKIKYFWIQHYIWYFFLIIMFIVLSSYVYCAAQYIYFFTYILYIYIYVSCRLPCHKNFTVQNGPVLCTFNFYFHYSPQERQNHRTTALASCARHAPLSFPNNNNRRQRERRASQKQIRRPPLHLPSEWTSVRHDAAWGSRRTPSTAEGAQLSTAPRLELISQKMHSCAFPAAGTSTRTIFKLWGRCRVDTRGATKRVSVWCLDFNGEIEPLKQLPSSNPASWDLNRRLKTCMTGSDVNKAAAVTLCGQKSFPWMISTMVRRCSQLLMKKWHYY